MKMKNDSHVLKILSLLNEALTGSYFLHAFINHKTKVNDGEMT